MRPPEPVIRLGGICSPDEMELLVSSLDQLLDSWRVFVETEGADEDLVSDVGNDAAYAAAVRADLAAEREANEFRRPQGNYGTRVFELLLDALGAMRCSAAVGRGMDRQIEALQRKLFRYCRPTTFAAMLAILLNNARGPVDCGELQVTLAAIDLQLSLWRDLPASSPDGQGSSTNLASRQRELLAQFEKAGIFPRFGYWLSPFGPGLLSALSSVLGRLACRADAGRLRIEESLARLAMCDAPRPRREIGSDDLPRGGRA